MNSIFYFMVFHVQCLDICFVIFVMPVYFVHWYDIGAAGYSVKDPMLAGCWM